MNAESIRTRLGALMAHPRARWFAIGGLLAVILMGILLAWTQSRTRPATEQGALAQARVVPAKQSREAAQMVAAARATWQRAKQAADPALQFALYDEASSIVDSATAKFPDLRTAYDLDPLLVDKVAFLQLAANRSRFTAERVRYLDMARNAALRYTNSAKMVSDLRAIGRDLGRADAVADARRALVDAYQVANRSAPENRDRLMLALVSDAVRLDPKARQTAIAWAKTIVSHRQRSDALELVARYQIFAGDVASPLTRTLRFKRLSLYDAGSTSLLQAAEASRLDQRYDVAQALALAAATGTLGRDALLATISEDWSASTGRFELMHGVYAIEEEGARSEAAATLARNALLGNAMYQAEAMLVLIDRPDMQADVKAHMIEALSWKGYASQIRRLYPDAVKQAKTIRDAPIRDRTLEIIGVGLAKSGMEAEATEVAAQIGDGAMRDNIYLETARRARAAKRYERMDTLLGKVSTPNGRATAARINVTAFVAQNLNDKAIGLAERIVDPVEGNWAKAIVAGGLMSTGQQQPAMEIADQIAAAVGDAPPLQQQPVMAAAIYAFAAVNQPEKSENLAAQAMAAEAWNDDTEISYERALSALAASWLRKGDVARAKDTTKWIVEDRQRWFVMRDLSLAMAHRGQFQLAAEYATTIEDAAQRVNALRAIAQASLNRLDHYQLNNKEPQPRSSFRNASILSDPVLRTQGFDFYSLQRSDVGAKVPSFPNLNRVTVDTITGAMPAVSPRAARQVRVLPMSYNAYNTKFISGVNLAFDELRKGYFPEAIQGTRNPIYIHIEKGVYDLPALVKDLKELGYDEILLQSGQRYLLKLPLFVAPGASLVVSGVNTETLMMEQATGAFIVNGGLLWTHSTTIIGWDSANSRPAPLEAAQRESFRPFIINWGGSKLYSAKTHFRNLGFESSKAFGMSFSQGASRVLRTRPENMPAPTGAMIENSFEELYFGLYTYATDRLIVVGNEYRNNMVYGIDPHDYSNALLIALNSAYGSREKHGIIGSRSVNSSWFVGNLSFGNAGTGLMIERLSSINLLYGNRIWGNRGDGIAVFESPCNIVAANDVDNGHHDALKVRNSWDIGVYRNTMRSAAQSVVNIYAADPDPGARHAARDIKKDPFSYYSDAAFVGNRLLVDGSAGFAAFGAGALMFGENEFVGGRKKLIAGDMRGIQNAIFKLSRDGGVVRTSCPPPTISQSCPFVRDGFVPGSFSALPPARNGLCTRQAATPVAGGREVGIDNDNDIGAAPRPIIAQQPTAARVAAGGPAKAAR